MEPTGIPISLVNIPDYILVDLNLVLVIKYKHMTNFKFTSSANKNTLVLAVPTSAIRPHHSPVKWRAQACPW